MNVAVHTKLAQQKKMMAQKMKGKTFDSGRAASIKDKHGFVRNGTGYSAMQSFK